MTHRLIWLAAVTLILSPAASPTFSAQPTGDCTAPDVSGETPGAAVTSEPAPGRADLTFSQRLSTCGSVLDPPAVGDPDIVEPAPRIVDPMNIHPGTPEPIRPKLK